MKLLGTDTRTIEDKDSGIVMELNAVTTSQQGKLVALGSVNNLGGRVELARYAMRELVKRLSIEGQDFNPAELADRADLGDPDTLNKFVMIGALAVEAAFPQQDEVKKSEPQHADTSE